MSTKIQSKYKTVNTDGSVNLYHFETDCDMVLNSSTKSIPLIASIVNWDSIKNEVIAARDGSSSLLGKIDSMEYATSLKANQTSLNTTNQNLNNFITSTNNNFLSYNSLISKNTQDIGKLKTDLSSEVGLLTNKIDINGLGIQNLIDLTTGQREDILNLSMNLDEEATQRLSLEDTCNAKMVALDSKIAQIDQLITNLEGALAPITQDISQIRIVTQEEFNALGEITETDDVLYVIKSQPIA